MVLRMLCASVSARPKKTDLQWKLLRQKFRPHNAEPPPARSSLFERATGVFQIRHRDLDELRIGEGFGDPLFPIKAHADHDVETQANSIERQFIEVRTSVALAQMLDEFSIDSTVDLQAHEFFDELDSVITRAERRLENDCVGFNDFPSLQIDFQRYS